MKRSLMLFVVLGWAFMAPISAQWHSVPRPVGIEYGIMSMWFQDTLTGYAGGGESAFVKTTDGGRSWFSMPTIPGPAWEINAIYFTPDGQEGWIAGQPIYTASTIMHTTDAGQTWTEQSYPVQDTFSVMLGIAEVGNEVWMVGLQYTSQYDGVLLRSTNRGQTWQRAVYHGCFFTTIQKHGDEVWITGGPGVVLKTTDIGASWDTLSIVDSQATLRGIFFGSTEWYVAGNGYGSSSKAGFFYASPDQGRTWQLRKTWQFDEMAIGAKVLVNNNTIYCLGLEALVEGRGRIYASTDGGFNWERVVDDGPGNRPIYASFQLDDQHMWAAGYNLWYYQPNASPVVSAISDTLVQAGSQVSIQVQASDAEGDTLSYHLLQAPDGLAVDSLSGVISGRPQSGGQVQVQVSDGIFGNDVQTSFRIFLNFPPQFGGNKQDTLDVIADSLEVLPFTWGDPNPEDTLDVAGDYPPGMFLRPNSQPPVGSITAELEVKMPVGVYPVSLWVMDDKGGVDTFSFYVRATSANDVREIPSGIPTEYRLYQNYPNPFNPATNIRFQVPKGSKVLLTVYNLLGEQVAVLVDERLAPGTYEADFFASNLPSGMYVYVIRAGDYTATKKMLLVK